MCSTTEPSAMPREGLARQWNQSSTVLNAVALAEGLVKGMGGEVDFRIEVGYPVLKNDVELTEKARLSAIAYLGESNVCDLVFEVSDPDFCI